MIASQVWRHEHAQGDIEANHAIFQERGGITRAVHLLDGNTFFDEPRTGPVLSRQAGMSFVRCGTCRKFLGHSILSQAEEAGTFCRETVHD